ncbi:DUF2975 domain-containing protein [Streptomyces sp. MNU89]|uniref:DUF2975 domain-containing protein n=1 Tax=Streptomyces sp. MNU89 TaxID=2560025 RepID=UPI001E4F4A08|nr:DUF2975 domain-containing protein [Streptomyces sp. MNU89]MCC9737617.1 DUF2975 domain-containing protein [Streptomyces sp. MNU89]
MTAQVTVACTWQLVTKARRNTMFSHTAFRYAHTATGTLPATAHPASTLAVLLAPGEAVAPGIVLLLCGGSLAVFGVALIVLVLRMLLAQAVARDAEARRMHAELEEVI